MNRLLKLAHTPAVGVSPDTPIREAVHVMKENGIGAVLVLEDGRARGIFTGRDVWWRVVDAGLPPDTTQVGDLMSGPVLTVPADGDPVAALGLMLAKKIHHLPVVDDAGLPVGVLSMRHLMTERIDGLRDEVQALDAYLSYDGATG